MNPEAATQNPYGSYGGTVAPPPNPTAGADPYASYGGAAKPAAAAQPQQLDLTNPRGEGVYYLRKPGIGHSVPYSEVPKAMDMGFTFGSNEDASRYNKDQSYATNGHAPIKDFHGLLQAIDELPSWTQWVPGINVAHQAVGGMHEIASTIEGGRKILGLEPKNPGPNDVTAQLAQHENTNLHQGEGGMMESMGEFFTGEELLGLLGKVSKVLPLAEQMKQATGLAQMLKKYPLISKLVNIGIASAKQATVGAGQEYLKSGGDAGAAAQAGIGAGLTSAAIGGLSARTASRIQPKLPGAEEIGGQPFETPSANEAVKPTKNQAAGQVAIKGAAQNTAAGHLQELNESRAPEPRHGAETEYFKSGNTWAERPRFGGPAHFDQIDIPKTVDRVGSYTDAARTVKSKAIEGFNQINDALALSGERPESFAQVRGAYQQAEQKFMNATTADELKAAEGEIEDAHGQLQQLVTKIPHAINLKELSGINDAYRNALSLEKFGRAVDSTFMGSPSSGASRAGEYFGFNGKQLRSNIDDLIRGMGRGRVDRLVGRDNVDTLMRVADLNTTNAGRAKFGAAVRTVKDNLIRMHVGPIAAGGYLGRMAGLPWEVGAAGGWATAEGMRHLSNLIVSKPQLAKNLLYALDYGAKPENYGPFIATMIRNMVDQSNKEEKQNGNEAR